ncbi:MAG TPA: RNB domain-containing ribonuclease [Acidobacteriaceae bacterium]|jgi:ribonuclease R|nr:RNB domain-containing ribonuclease [Acidobacteriaceae bacterium]
MDDRDLLRHIERLPNARAGYKQLVRELGLGGGQERRVLRDQLGRLTGQRKLTQVDGEHWQLRTEVPGRHDSRRGRPADAGRSAAGGGEGGRGTFGRGGHLGIREENLVAGRLDLHRDGFGFVRPNRAQARAAVDEDVFIPRGEMGGAMQGDQVLVELTPPRFGQRDGRRAGRVLRILTRRNTTVVGIFHYSPRGEGRGNIVVPTDERMTQPVVIPLGAELPGESAAASPHRVLGEEAKAARKARRPEQEHPDAHRNLEGLVVDVEITEWPTATRPARGRVIEVLGAEGDFGVDVEMVIRKHHLPRVFPEAVLEEAREVARFDPKIAARRRDFRALPIVTIDGETARDFDDAVLVRRHDDGSWELQVHIADVAQYVRPGTALDLEARLRGTSVYFPDRAIPMLPQELSTDICSLRPNEERLVLSCLMRLDAQGEILGYEICEGVIRSARRMTYTQVHGILEGDAALRTDFAPLVPEFERMLELAQVLNRKRDRRGSIDFDLPEPLIEFDEFGAMKAVTRAERNWAHRLIEEFMLSANECVASWLENLGVPSLYRIHEKPEPRRVVEFEEIAAAFGYSLGIGSLPVRTFRMKGERREQQARREQGRGSRPTRGYEVAEEIAITPRMYQKLTEKIAGKPEERILSYLMLRSLKQARYSEKNAGHFALAAECYTHFTSPIRRYPDLIVHRITKELLRDSASSDTRFAPTSTNGREGRRHAAIRKELFAPIEQRELAPIATESSENERRAADAERELVEWKKIQFMRDRVGEALSGMILNATKYGLFVELDDLFVEGLVPLQTLGMLDGDRYTYRENTRQVIGDRWRRKFSVGQRVRVVLDRVDAVEKRLQFSILEEDEAPHGKKPGSTSGKKKKRADAASDAGTGSQGAQHAPGTRPRYRPPRASLLQKRKKRR